MPRYRLRTLLIVLALGPPLLAWVWFHGTPLGIALAICLLGTAIGLTLLWVIQGLLAISGLLLTTLRQAMHHKKPPDNEGEFSLSRFATEIKARRKE